MEVVAERFSEQLILKQKDAIINIYCLFCFQHKSPFVVQHGGDGRLMGMPLFSGGLLLADDDV